MVHSAWVNAQGQPVAMQARVFQFDLPAEPVADPLAILLRIFTTNFGAVIQAAIKLAFALAAGDFTAAMKAIQELITALMS